MQAARDAINERTAEIIQSFNSQSDTGPVTVISIKMVNGLPKVNVRTQDGRVIEDVDPGTDPIGPGTVAILLSGKKLQ